MMNTPMRKSIILLIHLLALGLCSRGQWYQPEKVNKKARFIYSNAITELQLGSWKTGCDLLLQAIKLEPRYVEAWLSLMSAYGEQKKYDSATLAFETAWKLDSVFSEEMLLPYSINLAGMGRFAEALEAVTRYAKPLKPDSRAAKAAAYRAKTYRFALDWQQANAQQGYEFKPINLGDSINSNRSEYYPSLTINDSLLIFTRAMGGIREDFFSSRLLPNGSYEAAKPVKGALNEEPSKGGLQITADGDMLFFAGNFQQSGYGDFDIYICTATPDGWSSPYNPGKAINTEYWESSPCISPDKRMLIFSSNRPGGYGGKDLYVSYRRPDGRWSLAENLGPTINTPADELAPYFHADNQTLYFTSGGHPGYGGSDLYLSRRKSNGEWEKPFNLGYPINTIDDDGSLIVAADGKTAYFASFRSDSKGGLDLYRFELPAYAQAKQTQWVQGRVYDAATRKGLPSAIELKNINDTGWVQRVVTDETGQYLITLPVGESYSLTVSRKGYLYYSDFFSVTLLDKDSSLQKDIPLQPIEVNAGIELKNIQFETNSYTLQKNSYAELDKLVQLLEENPAIKIEIGGHTDNTGNAADNLKLSQNRAKAVVEYLRQKGISQQRMTYKGYGDTKPIAPNDTEMGRAKNRRTEVKIISF
jgi:outer membrane protein OmpA-like peptidoglycan-associated protein